MSQVKMLKPSDGVEGIKDFVLKVVEEAGPNACPPMVIGVGIGGTFDYVAYLAKKAMLRKIGTHHLDKRYQQLEEELLEKINQTGIGPAGYGGKITALSLNIETYPTHIAGMPVAVSIVAMWLDIRRVSYNETYDNTFDIRASTRTQSG